MKLTALRPPDQLLLPLAILSLYLLLGGFYLRDYLLWDSQWLLAMLLVPLVAQVQPGRSLSPGLLLAATVLATLAFSLQNSTFYFFAFLFGLWCGAQMLFGRVSLYPLLLLAVASPIFKYVANIISFPLRLQLTSWAVLALNKVGLQAEAAGNIILVNGEDFSVDPACAGLSMLSLSLLVAVFILAHLQKKNQKQWPLWLTGLMLGIMLLLNLASNLLRILLLVLFKVLPDNPMHDVLGLLCLLFYALIPFYFMAKFLYHRFGKPMAPKPASSGISLGGSLLLNYLLLLMLLGVGVRLQFREPQMAVRQAPQLSGFEQTAITNGVTRYSNREALIYLKPVQAFYSTEHHPLICWEGSGYKFKHVQSQQFGHNTVYTGVLQNGSDKLYTAWWMDNGEHRTIDQWDWRWRMLKGEAKFSLVNITVAQKEELPQAIAHVINQFARPGIVASHAPANLD